MLSYYHTERWRSEQLVAGRRRGKRLGDNKQRRSKRSGGTLGGSAWMEERSASPSDAVASRVCCIACVLLWVAYICTISQAFCATGAL